MKATAKLLKAGLPVVALLLAMMAGDFIRSSRCVKEIGGEQNALKKNLRRGRRLLLEARC